MVSDAERPIGLIGCGAIGRDLLGRLRSAGHAVVVLLREGSPSRAGMPAGLEIVATPEALLSLSPILVVEAAGQNAVRATVPAILEAGVPVVIASTGALGDPDLLASLTHAAAKGRAKLVIPAGAVGGLDYLAALEGTPDARVRYTSRKPPAAWVAELAAMGLAADMLGTAVTLFEGTAAEAARLYPRNLNAGLTVALAAGAAETTVRVVADPAVALNTHEIEVDSALGFSTMRFGNMPSRTNPKTSAITAASLAAAVRRSLDPVSL